MDKDINAFKELKRQSLNDLQILANEYHSHILKSKDDLLFFILPLLENLTETKKRVLKHLMSGQPMKTIPQTYDISQRFAEKTLVNIRKDFGNISTNELMYILGMVNMHEYL